MVSLINKKTESAHGLDLGSGDGSRASKETGQIEGGKILTSYEKKNIKNILTEKDILN